MNKHVVALLYILPLVLFFMLVLVYPFADMMYQGAMPKLEILNAGGADDVAGYFRCSDIAGAGRKSGAHRRPRRRRTACCPRR